MNQDKVSTAYPGMYGNIQIQPPSNAPPFLYEPSSTAISINSDERQEELNKPLLDEDSIKRSEIKPVIRNLVNHTYLMNLFTTFTILGVALVNPSSIWYLPILGGYLCFSTGFTQYQSKKLTKF